ncbi:MAG: T9SS type A sorting domain-containing protein, partial [Caldithrix sp.]|nr:T9SS type A sorting domain-containing protein [Caldithrix sp.]
SLQLTGSGTQYSDFIWSANLDQTWGAQNDGGDQSLPVELISFTAHSINQHIILRWTAASEIDNMGFEILRATGQNNKYNTIASFKDHPQLRGAGTVSHTTDYRFVDTQVRAGHTYWYRLVDVDVNGRRTKHNPISVSVQSTSNDPRPAEAFIPQKFQLAQNYPNPFNPITVIPFNIPQSAKGPAMVEITIYNVLGLPVRTLFSGRLQAGRYRMQWDATDNQGRSLSSGVYFYQLKSRPFTAYRKMVLMR